MNVIVIVNHLSIIYNLFQKFQEKYFISILESTFSLPKKIIKISTKFKFNQWNCGWYE